MCEAIIVRYRHIVVSVLGIGQVLVFLEYEVSIDASDGYRQSPMLTSERATESSLPAKLLLVLLSEQWEPADGGSRASARVS